MHAGVALSTGSMVCSPYIVLAVIGSLLLVGVPLACVCSCLVSADVHCVYRAVCGARGQQVPSVQFVPWQQAMQPSGR